MHANLMRAPGTQLTTHLGIFAKALYDLIVRDGLASIFLYYRHLFAVRFIAGYKRFNRATIALDNAAHHCLIGAAGSFRLNLLG